jgi:Ca2+-binding EF-hand superfamily protein
LKKLKESKESKESNESKDFEMVEQLTRKSFHMIDSDQDGLITGQDLHKLIEDVCSGGYGHRKPSKPDCDCA